MHKVFVYGSLKKGFGNSYLLDNSKYLGRAMTKDQDWFMFSMGGFPGVVRGNHSNANYLDGEVYVVDDDALRNLDALEGNGSFYTREEIPLQNGTTAWMYVLPDRDRYQPERHNDRVGYDEDLALQTWMA